MLSQTNNRQILFIVDQVGNTSKTWLAQWLVQQHRAFYCNYTGFHDVMFAYKGQSIVVFDICRDAVADLHYGTIEALENGITFSKKYESQMRLFHPSQIVVCLNSAPDLTKLSADRYVVKTVDKLQAQFDQRVCRRESLISLKEGCM